MNHFKLKAERNGNGYAFDLATVINAKFYPEIKASLDGLNNVYVKLETPLSYPELLERLNSWSAKDLQGV